MLVEERKGDVLILRVKGRLDAISAPVVEKRIFDAIENEQYKILLDVAAVNYLSSAGMRMLLSSTKRLRSLSGKLNVVNMTANVLDVLKMSGFDHVLELFETEQGALKHF